MTFVSDLSPQSLWRHFDHLLTIPRGSKQEAKASSYVLGVAADFGLVALETDGGNVLVRKPGTSGFEAAESVVLQAHLDMVQEKNAGTQHDFAVDPIRPVRESSWLMAEGTTLGADNGIGVAAMLALMEEEQLRHGPLEFLFTVDEETGLTGAKELSAEMLEGRYLINLDSEQDGVITIGCAGGGDTRIHVPIERANVSGGFGLQVDVCGLKGGHSGVDIHLQRGNAIRILSRMLFAVDSVEDMRIARLAGGNARNAIPREARATIWFPDESNAASGRDVLMREFDAIAKEIRVPDPGLSVSVDSVSPPGNSWNVDSTDAV
ncbi:MAG: M20/M25/M40 family metallo-hydrolase, partial [Gemmatimonadales bacterium]